MLGDSENSQRRLALADEKVVLGTLVAAAMDVEMRSTPRGSG